METVRSADGTRIAYERGGMGPPLVIIGGMSGDPTWIDPLARGCLSPAPRALRCAVCAATPPAVARAESGRVEDPPGRHWSRRPER